MVAAPFSLFEGKRILITGHTGFKGSWLTVWLRMLGADVTGYSLPTKPALRSSWVRTEKGVREVFGDIRDHKKLSNTFKASRPDIVFHLAAQPLVLESYMNPLETLQTNVMGSANVLECVRHSDVKVLIYATSDKCYRNENRSRGYRETDPLGGFDCYSASKAAAEIIFDSYRQSFFMQRENPGVASVRSCNVIGGGDASTGRLIPDVIRAFRAKKAIQLRHPRAVRGWQHVLDTLHGYLLLAGRLHRSPQSFSGAWNFGPTDRKPYTVAQVVDFASRAWGTRQLRITQAHLSKKWKEESYLTVDASKAKTKLGWTPVWSMQESVQMTVEWYKSFFEKPATDRTHEQIRRFMNQLSHD